MTCPWVRLQAASAAVTAVAACGGLWGAKGAVSDASLQIEQILDLESRSKANKINRLYGDNYRGKMSFFTEYRDAYAKEGIDYADAFAKYAHDTDKEAERCRGALGGFWDNVVEDHRTGLLPKAFFTADGNKWLQRARNYRMLVEPIDEANHKRLGFDKKLGGYGENNNRPSQYVYIEKLERDADSLAAKP